jgi:hypothetical protein
MSAFLDRLTKGFVLLNPGKKQQGLALKVGASGP